jgi:hypothetical protein
VHLRAPSFALVFGRGRGGDNGGIDDRSLPHQQATLLQQRPDFVEQCLGQPVALQPMAKVQDCRLLRNAATVRSMPAKPRKAWLP